MEGFGPLFKQIIDGVRAHQEDPQPNKEQTDKIRANIERRDRLTQRLNQLRGE